jgi:hypothetical protein
MIDPISLVIGGWGMEVAPPTSGSRARVSVTTGLSRCPACGLDQEG